MKNLFLFISLICCNSIIAQTTLYVNPAASNNPSADGSLANPYNDIASTVELVAATGGEVIIIDGNYNMSGKEVTITTAATESTIVTIRPETPAGVKLRFDSRFGFEFEPSSQYIALEGLELDGQTNQLDYWSIVAQAFWGDSSIPRNGGLAVILDGQYITVKDNYIHDWYQKAIEIRDARYAVIEGNIIHDIAKTSISGGHGIMRQQKGQEFFDDDIMGVYRWDIRENMVFNVEQTIYSWVPSKGFIEMVIDEGKSILIDDPKDTNGNQEHMSARIINNIVAFGSVDHIRLKSTPNLEVSHNSIYAEGLNADGISDKQGDTNTPQFTNFICQNNASQTDAGVSAIEIDKAVEQTNSNGGTPNVSGNYAMDGKIKPPSQSGLIKLTNGQLFINPTGGNFRINPALNLPASTGVMTSVLDDLDLKVGAFGVPVGPGLSGVDHLKLTQTILDNVPGLNDGIAGNETVFADYGTMTSNYHTITFDVVNGSWKSNNNSPNTQDFELNEVYYTWYQNVATTHLNINGEEYERIRWGDSEVRQNQVFDPDWLTVSQITSTSSNTLINGADNDFVLDGDILIDFENFTPQIGDVFDLMTANSITSNNSGTDLFDRVLFEGFTPNFYALEVINLGGNQVLRLIILAALPVELLSFDVRKDDQFVHLNWKTASEQNNAFFSIERSTDKRQWEEIGRVKGQGNSAILTNYNFIDKIPYNGSNYYRLIQTDEDGTISYSKIISVVWNKTESSISVYPNPSTGQVSIDWDNKVTHQQVDIEIYDIFGNLAFAARKSTNKNQTIDVSTLKNGIYFLHVYRNNTLEHLVKITKI